MPPPGVSPSTPLFVSVVMHIPSTDTPSVGGSLTLVPPPPLPECTKRISVRRGPAAAAAAAAVPSWISAGIWRPPPQLGHPGIWWPPIELRAPGTTCGRARRYHGFSPSRSVSMQPNTCGWWLGSATSRFSLDDGLGGSTAHPNLVFPSQSPSIPTPLFAPCRFLSLPRVVRLQPRSCRRRRRSRTHLGRCPRPRRCSIS